MKRLLIAVLLLLISSFNTLKSRQLLKLSLSAQSYDPRLFGTWQVKTVVVDSHCKYVDEGAESFSKLNFSLVDGKLSPTWFGHNWNLVENKMFKLEDNNKLVWVRENSLVKNNKFWIARSQDLFDIHQNNSITATSYISQYLNGKYVGDYKTRSYLKRF